MKTTNPSIPDIELKLNHPIVPVIIPLKKIKVKPDIVLNVNFKDELIRVAIALFLAMLTVFTHTHLIIYIAPLIFYLFVSALLKFCIVKYLWRRYIKHEPAAKRIKYGEDPNYPEESV